MRAIEASGVAGRVLRTTGDATACVYRVTASYTRKYKTDLTLYITMTVLLVLTNINFWTEVQSYGKVSYLHPSGSWNIC